MSDSHYDIAQICPNGHVISTRINSSPQHRQAFCDQCGEATISACPNCKTSFRGYYHVPGALGGYDYERPGFCFLCGKAFPWTERQQQAAIDLFIDEVQDAESRAVFRESIEQIAKDTPQAQVASNRIVKLLKKVPAATGSAIRDILINVAGEAAKTIIFPSQ